MSPSHIFNLPNLTTSFIGREPDIEAIHTRLFDPACRLLTIAGEGGIGKTRLAIESVLRLPSEAFVDGIYYVSLVATIIDDDIVTQLINALHIQIDDKHTPQEELITYLSQCNLLLVFDNTEHLISKILDLILIIIQHCPNIKIMTTSREYLNLQAEYVWHLKGLPYPDDMTLDQSDNYTAIQLFVERAQQIQAHFVFGNHFEDVYRICRLVNGLPLAIELATSWLSSLSCKEIIHQIQHSIDLLSTHRHDIPKRHRSIRAVFDYSWHRLTEDEQAVFRQLSIFQGGFTLKSAQQIAGASLLIISSLVKKSMIRSNNQGRYDLHELVRQYASERLEAIADTTALWMRYTHYFADFMSERTADIKGRRQIESLDEIEADFDNIRLAWYRSITEFDERSLIKMAETLVIFCDIRSHFHMGYTLFHDAIQQLQSLNLESISRNYNRLHVHYLQVHILPQKYPVPENIFQMAEDCLKVAEEQEDWFTQLMCHTLFGMYTGFTGDKDKGLSHLEHAMTIAEAHQALYYEARVLRILDNFYTFNYYEDTEKAVEVNQQFEWLTRQISDYHGLMDALFIKARRYMKQGRHKEHLDTLKQTSEYANMVNDSKSLATITSCIGIEEFYEGELQNAHHNLSAALVLYKRLNFWGNIIYTYIFLSMIETLEERYHDALLFSNQAKYYNYRPIGSAIFLTKICQLIYFIATNHSNRHSISLAELSTHTQKIPRMQLMLVVAGVFLLAEQHQYSQATSYLALAYTHPATNTGWLERWRLLGELRTDLQHQLGEDAYLKAWQQGESLNLDEVMVELSKFMPSSEGVGSSVNQSLIEPLTERELEVLQHINQGLSNREIADLLIVAEGTIKKHIYNIYQKLGVKRRTQAIQKSKDFGLL